MFTTISSIDRSVLANVKIKVMVNSRYYSLLTNSQGVANRTIYESISIGDTIRYTASGGADLATIMNSVMVTNAEKLVITEFIGPKKVPVPKYRAVLNWNPLPKDIDLQVIEFSWDGKSCHTYWNNMKCNETSLHTDNRVGGHHGPETVTWRNSQENYSYLIFAHLYSREKEHSLVTSGVS